MLEAPRDSHRLHCACFPPALHEAGAHAANDPVSQPDALRGNFEGILLEQCQQATIDIPERRRRPQGGAGGAVSDRAVAGVA